MIKSSEAAWRSWLVVWDACLPAALPRLRPHRQPPGAHSVPGPAKGQAGCPQLACCWADAGAHCWLHPYTAQASPPALQMRWDHLALGATHPSPAVHRHNLHSQSVAHRSLDSSKVGLWPSRRFSIMRCLTHLELTVWGCVAAGLT